MSLVIVLKTPRSFYWLCLYVWLWEVLYSILAGCNFVLGFSAISLQDHYRDCLLLGRPSLLLYAMWDDIFCTRTILRFFLWRGNGQIWSVNMFRGCTEEVFWYMNESVIQKSTEFRYVNPQKQLQSAT